MNEKNLVDFHKSKVVDKMNDKENSINISESENLLLKSGYIVDNNNWSDYTFLGKLFLLFSIVCLFCFMIIVISLTIVAVRAWL